MKITSKILTFALVLVLLAGGAGQTASAADGDLLEAQPVGAFVNSFTDNVMDIFMLTLVFSGEKHPAQTDITDIVMYYNGNATPVVCNDGDVGYMTIAYDDRNDAALQLLITPTLLPNPGEYCATFKYRGISYRSSTLIVEHTGIGGTSYDTSTFGRLDGGEVTPGDEPQAPALVAIPTNSTVFVNGASVAFDAYNINGNNYFKLRDLAYILNGTEKQFEVDWDGEANAISLTSGKGYTAVGGEMVGKGSGEKTPNPTNSKILLNGQEISLAAYNIDGNNYFKLRDIGAAFDFGVDWDGANNAIMIDTGKGYTDPTIPVLIPYSYSELTISFEWGPDKNNPDAIGGCTLKFTLDGDKSGVSKVLIAGWRQAWADEDIIETAELILPIWKQQLSFGSFDGNVHTSFPIDANELGTTSEVLLLVLNGDGDAIGHVIVTVTIPASIS